MCASLKLKITRFPCAVHLVNVSEVNTEVLRSRKSQEKFLPVFEYVVRANGVCLCSCVGHTQVGGCLESLQMLV